MQTRCKFIIKIVLLSMVLLNVIMACIVLLPVETAQGAGTRTETIYSAQPKTPQVSLLQRIKIADQAARNFWVGLLPFWDS